MSNWSYRGKVAAETIGFLWDDICEFFDGIKDGLIIAHFVLMLCSVLWCAVMLAVQVKHHNYLNWHWWVWIPFAYLVATVIGYIMWWIRSAVVRAKMRLR